MLKTGKNHSGHPEENNIPARYQYTGRIKILQIIGGFRPPQGGKRPQGTAEPGVQNIFILPQLSGPASRTLGRVSFAADHFRTIFTIPNRYPVSPPQLPGDTPVPDALHPVGIDFSKTIGYKFYFTLHDLANGRFSQGFHFNKPLFRNQGFNDCITSLTMTYRMPVIFCLQ